MAREGIAAGASNPKPAARFRVGNAEVDTVSHEASYGASTEKIQPQNLKVLAVLAQNAGSVVTRDELIERCWGGRVIGDDVIHRAISTLRQFAARAGGFTIETVPRVGYRLRNVRRRTRSKRVVAAIAIALGGIAAISAFLLPRSLGNREKPTLRIALLPFEADADDAATKTVAFAAHDSVSHALAQTRFALMETGPDTSRQPDADFLMLGDVESAPNAITATVSMEQAKDHAVVYSRRFSVPGAEAWKLPDLVGPEVAGSLSWTEPLLLAQRRYPSDPSIIADLLQKDEDVDQLRWLGNYERSRRDAERAPHSAVAQIAFAFTSAYNLANFPRAQSPAVLEAGRAAAVAGEHLAPDLGDAHIPWCLLHTPARLLECEDRLRAAMRSDPDSSWVEYNLADRLKNAGRLNDALQLAQRTLATDDFNPDKIALTLRLLEATGDTSGAETLFAKADRWWPESGIIFWDRLYGIIGRGDFAELLRFRAQTRHDVMFREVKFGAEPIPELVAAVKSRNIASARRLCPVNQPGSFRRDLCMIVYSRIGDVPDAIALASRIFPDRVGRSPLDEEELWLDNPIPTDTDILMGAGAASLRKDPRFVEIARRIGLLAYWRSGRLPDVCGTRDREPVCESMSAKGR